MKTLLTLPNKESLRNISPFLSSLPFYKQTRSETILEPTIAVSGAHSNKLLDIIQTLSIINPMTKTIEGAIVDWLEEIPVEELGSETSQRIVEDFRANLIDVTEAIAYLQEECADELLDYVNRNKELVNFLDLSTNNL